MTQSGNDSHGKDSDKTIKPQSEVCGTGTGGAPAPRAGVITDTTTGAIAGTMTSSAARRSLIARSPPRAGAPQ